MYQDTRQVKYHGLQNQGATCYLNSVLQVLFMTEGFREKVKRHSRKHAGTEHIDKELSALFSNLEESYTHTKGITDKLRIYNVYEQRDAAEYYEKILRLTSDEASQTFHGELRNWNQCQNCGKVTQSAAGFWHLPLPLVNNANGYSVDKGIKDFFHPSLITGDDQMYCEDCDRKCDALLGCEMKCLPEVLVLLLKRFEMIYDGNSFRKVKNNCAVKMPNTLHMKELGKCCYKLYAFVEHFGELKYGHYNAKIKSPDEGQWHIFDDLNIKEADYQHFQLDPTEMSTDVYLLFYRRQKGDTSLTNTVQHYTRETPKATVTNGTKYTNSSTEEGENTTTVATGVNSAFRMDNVSKDSPVRLALKRGAVSEGHDDEFYVKPKEASCGQDKVNKKHEPSQNEGKKFQCSGSVFQSQTGIVITMPDDTHEAIRERNKQKRKHFDQSEYPKWSEPNVEIKKKGSCRPPHECDTRERGDDSPVRQQSTQQGYSSAGQASPVKNKMQKRPSPQKTDFGFASRQEDMPEYRAMCGPKEGMTRAGTFCVKSDRDALDRGRQVKEGDGHIMAWGRHSFHGQASQWKNVRSNTERNGGQREKERGTYYYKGKVAGQFQEEAPYRLQPEKCLPSRTLQQAQHTTIRAQSKLNDGYSVARERDAYDLKSGPKTSTSYSQNNQRSFSYHPRSNRQTDLEIIPLQEEKKCNNTQITEESQTLARGKAVPDTNVHQKKTKWWKKLLCCFKCKKRSK